MDRNDNVICDRNHRNEDDVVQNYVHGFGVDFRRYVSGSKNANFRNERNNYTLNCYMNFILFIVIVGNLEENDVWLLVNSDYHLHDNTSNDIYIPIRRHTRVMEKNWYR